MVHAWLAMMLVAGLFVSPALGRGDASADPRIDERGREVARYAPDSPWAFEHVRIEIDIADISKAELRGVATLRGVAVGQTRSRMRLDCDGPRVEKVTGGWGGAGSALKFEQAADGGELVIDVPPTAAGSVMEVKVAYTLEYGANKGDGLTYSAGKAGAESETVREPQIHAQGQSELNRKWFPCHDSPNQRLTSEVVVTVEAGFEVLSNGRLVSKEKATAGVRGGGGVERVRWHWVQGKPHASYLITLAVAKFGVVEVGGPGSARPGIAMPVYVPKGQEELARAMFGNTPRMMAFFERVFGEPYPWDMYAQGVVRDFTAGGMENTSATLLTSRLLRAKSDGSGEPRDEDETISHELAHQWTGDLVTCKTWGHIWLNEGWATYSEALWAEERAKTDAGGDEEAGRKAYTKMIRQWLRGQRLLNVSEAPKVSALVTNRYTNPDKLFERAEDPYSKGALVLHMLRVQVGDVAFFKGLKAYIQQLKFGQAETGDFRRAMERASGQSLSWFFDQWVMRPGIARVALDYQWDEGASTLEIGVEQTRTIDRLNPAYSFELPFYVKYADGSASWVYVDVSGKTGSMRAVLKGRPASIVVDPTTHVLMAFEIRTPLKKSDAKEESEAKNDAGLGKDEAGRAEPQE